VLCLPSDVSEYIRIVTSAHEVKNAGKHIVKFWLVNPGVVLKKIVIETTGAKTSYLGPP